jgi:hypothetical protein
MVRLVVSSRPAAAPPGGRAVIWDEARPSESEALSAAEGQEVEKCAIAWAQRWTRVTLANGQSFRDLASWKGLSLGYFAEIALHDATEAPRWVRVIERLSRVLVKTKPDEVRALDLPADVTLLLYRLCRVCGVFFEGRVPTPRGGRRRAVLGTAFAARAQSAKSLLRAMIRLSPGGRSTAARGEDDCERVLRHLDAPVLSVGRPGRREALEAWRAARYCQKLWRELRKTPGIHESFSHRDIPFADLAAPDFARMLLHEIPQALAAYEETLATLDRWKPSAVCLRNQAGVVSRALAAAAQARGVPCVVIPRDLRYSPPCVLEPESSRDAPAFTELPLGGRGPDEAVQSAAERIRQMAGSGLVALGGPR